MTIEEALAIGLGKTSGHYGKQQALHCLAVEVSRLREHDCRPEKTIQKTHHDTCWRDHHECAIRHVEFLEEQKQTLVMRNEELNQVVDALTLELKGGDVE